MLTLKYQALENQDISEVNVEISKGDILGKLQASENSVVEDIFLATVTTVRASTCCIKHDMKKFIKYTALWYSAEK